MGRGEHGIHWAGMHVIQCPLYIPLTRTSLLHLPAPYVPPDSYYYNINIYRYYIHYCLTGIDITNGGGIDMDVTAVPVDHSVPAVAVIPWR